MAAANTVAARIAGAVFMLSALGEMAVGLALLVVPSIAPFLIAAPLDASGLLLARMMGGAVLALGVTWWLARRDRAAVSRVVPGFFIYNLAVGILFVVAAVATAHPALPALLAAAHILIGAVFAAASASARERSAA